MRVKMLALGGILLSLTLINLGCSSGSSTTKLNGAGASFPAPLYNKWFKDYSSKHRGVQIDYQSVGSGKGESMVLDGTVDFGASDAPTPDQLSKVERGVVFLPMTAGSVVLAFNVEGVADLKLSRQALAGIFLGKVTKWNDDLIKKANPGVNLPDKAITVVVRQDSSGTTSVFTNHLAAISPVFKKAVGINKSPNWPGKNIIKAPKNDGVAGQVKQNPGSIGYMEYGYAMQSKLPMAYLENKEGKMVAPTIEAAKAALASIELPEDLVSSEGDPKGADSYPIVSYTWLICYKTYEDKDKLNTLKDMVKYCLHDGQQISESLGYIPLPEVVTAKVEASLEKIQLASKK